MEEHNTKGGPREGPIFSPFPGNLDVLTPDDIAQIERAIAQVEPSGKVRIIVEHGQVSAVIPEVEQ
ncbi:MAG TPA: hypothetical protein EYP04_03280 [Anaerolineae bacterium]|nr:hypothetical protein [Anaerolineae bacterium]HIQ05026.1 hypothetical protein [Anaerolineae bacterium]